MITKIILGASKQESILVQFGTGDIMFHCLEGPDMKFALGFNQHEPRPIGATTEEYNKLTSDDLLNKGLPTPVIFEFTKPESITALIHSLIELQKKMFDARDTNN